MLILGLLLILGAVVITVGAFFDAGETATVEVLGQSLTTTAAGVFVIGAVTMLMFLLGVWALKASMSRSRRKRAERKDARTRHRDSVRSLEEERESLRAENERLSQQLSTRQPATAGAGAGAAAAGAASAGAMSRDGHDSHDTDRMHDRDRDGVDDRSESSGQSGHHGRSLMDRMTGRHGSTESSSTDHHSTHSTGSEQTPYDDRSSDPYLSGEPRQSDRVIDQDTDLRRNESTSSSRSRDTI